MERGKVTGSPGFVLDTHIWVWWLTGSESLEPEPRRICEDTSCSLFLSVISVWEVAKLVEKKKLRFSLPLDQWLAEAVEVKRLTVVPLNLPIILASTRLGVPGDPGDQLIMATALHLNLPLLTQDEAILKSGVVPVA